MEVKLKIPFLYKDDIELFYEEITKILKHSFPLSRENYPGFKDDEFKALNKTTGKRLEQLIQRSIRQFKQNVDYCKRTRKQAKTVFQPPDEKLVKINAVKLEMIKSSMLAVKQQQRNRLPIKIETKQAFDMKVRKKNGDIVSIDKYFENRSRNFPTRKESYEKIKKHRKMLKKAIQNVQGREKCEKSQSNF